MNIQKYTPLIHNQKDFCENCIGYCVENCYFKYILNTINIKTPDELNTDSESNIIKKFNTYSMFLVKYRPFRFIIARTYDNKFTPFLNINYKDYIKNFKKLKATFSEWYDFYMDENFMINSLYYYNMNTLIYSETNQITGDICVNYFNKELNMWTKQVWNKYKNILYFDNTNVKFDLNIQLFYICIALVEKYNYLTIKIDIDTDMNFINILQM
jgi:hypothetical protein